MKADRHAIHGNLQPHHTVHWLSKYGYRTLPHVSSGGIGSPGGIVFSRPGGAVQMAVVGDVLRYDKRKKAVVVDYPVGTVVAS